MRKTCLFCHRTLIATNRAKEHVVARNLLRKLEILKVDFGHSHLQSASDGWDGLQITPPKTERKFVYDAFVCGRVCKNCNNGWMSHLETEFNRILGDFCDVESVIYNLKEEDKFTLARWAAKTAFVLSDTVKPAVGGVPDRHARVFYQSEGFPDSFLVSIAKSDDDVRGFRFSFSNTWAIEVDSESIDVPNFGYSGAYKIFFHMRNIMFLVCHYPVYFGQFLAEKERGVVLVSTALHLRFVKKCPLELGESFLFSMSVGMKLPDRGKALKPPRNSTCFCGSGEKFKHCHGKK